MNIPNYIEMLVDRAEKDIPIASRTWLANGGTTNTTEIKLKVSHNNNTDTVCVVFSHIYKELSLEQNVNLPEPNAINQPEVADMNLTIHTCITSLERAMESFAKLRDPSYIIESMSMFNSDYTTEQHHTACELAMFRRGDLVQPTLCEIYEARHNYVIYDLEAVSGILEAAHSFFTGPLAHELDAVAAAITGLCQYGEHPGFDTLTLDFPKASLYDLPHDKPVGGCIKVAAGLSHQIDETPHTALILRLFDNYGLEDNRIHSNGVVSTVPAGNLSYKDIRMILTQLITSYVIHDAGYPELSSINKYGWVPSKKDLTQPFSENHFRMREQD